MDRRVFSKASFAAMLAYRGVAADKFTLHAGHTGRARLAAAACSGHRNLRLAKDYPAKDASGFGCDAEGAMHLTCCFDTDMLKQNTHLILRHTQ